MLPRTNWQGLLTYHPDPERFYIDDNAAPIEAFYGYAVTKAALEFASAQNFRRIKAVRFKRAQRRLVSLRDHADADAFHEARR